MCCRKHYVVLGYGYVQKYNLKVETVQERINQFVNNFALEAISFYITQDTIFLSLTLTT